MNKEIWAIYKIDITSGDEEMKFVAQVIWINQILNKIMVK